MFSFFAFLYAICGILGTGCNLFVYIKLYQRDPWDVNNSACLIIGISIFVVSLIGFLMMRKLAKMDRSIRDLEYRLNTLSSALSRVNYKAGDKNVDVEKEDFTVDKIKQQIDRERSEKYQDHIRTIVSGFGSGKYQTAKLRPDVFAPKDWEENILGSRETWLAMYQYYDDLLPILLQAKAEEDVIIDVCEESYRLIGFLGENLKGKCSDIMSYYCDVEEKTYGKSAKLTAMCQKLDSIGALDRGQPFSNRLK